MSAPSESEQSETSSIRLQRMHPTDLRLPPFLRECRRLQYHFPEPFYLYSPERDREVELSTNFETLLATEDASKLLLRYLFKGKPRTVCTDIVWLSNDTFISPKQNITFFWSEYVPHECVFTADIDFSESYDDENHDENHDGSDHNLCCSFYRIRTPPNTPTTTSLVASTDALLRILAKDKAITKIELCNHKGLVGEPFPASLAAIKDFVSEATSPRELDLDQAALSIDQWRAVVFNCHKTNVTLRLEFCDRGLRQWLGTTGIARTGTTTSSSGGGNGGNPLIEAMRLNQCPTKLVLLFNWMSSAAIKEFSAALEVNTSLKELTVLLNWVCCDTLFGAISRNKGLACLTFKSSYGLSDNDWELFWNTAIATHPTLNALHFQEGYASPESEVRDDVIVQSLRSNTALCTLDIQGVLYDRDRFLKKINPILKLNNFRPLVQAIKNEPDTMLRERLFTLTLLDPKVTGNNEDEDAENNYHNPTSLSLCYFLLKENRDLLVNASCRKDSTMCRRASVEGSSMCDSDSTNLHILDACLGKRKHS